MNSTSSTTRARRRQFGLAAALLTGVFTLAAIGVYIMGDDKPTQDGARKSDIRTKSYIAPGETVDPKDAWRGVSDVRLNTLEQKLGVLEADNRMLKGQLSGKTGAAPAVSAAENLSSVELDKRLAAYEASVERSQTAYPTGNPARAVAGQTASPAGRAMPQPPSVQAQGTARTPAASGPGNTQHTLGITTVRLVRPVGAGASIPAAPASPPARPNAKSALRTMQSYLPAGMFGRAVLLSGLDAPTGGQSQSDPHPVLLQLLDPAVLPNRYRYDWAQCLITGAGYGDLSSERSYIRTESLSCVSRDGFVLDVPIKGYIVGEDGKAGMRGRLVSKQGQVLGNALLTGVVSGIGTGIERSSTITSVSPLGATTSQKPGQEFQSGIGAGIGKGLDRLANYYISLAEKMFPVIEIDAARVVDIVLTEGVNVDVAFNHEHNE